MEISSKSIIIFGRSPFINTIEDKIPLLQSKYRTMGINSFPISFPNVEYWIFHDPATVQFVKDYYKGQKLITQSLNKKQLKPLTAEFYYPIQNNTAVSLNYEDNGVSFVGYTISCALNWCLKRGYNTVYLAGIDHNQDWSYFDTTYTKKHPREKTEKIRNYIYLMNQFINIYQLNPDNDMEIPKMKVEGLL